MKKNLNKVVAIVGPTASGKTSYSIELAQRLNAEIISADSRLVYKGFDIGTAKPTKAEMNGILHHMIDIVEPECNYSVGLYVQEAKKRIYDILNKGKTPIIVGGTGLYINALLMNYNFPKAEPDYELREKLKKQSNLYEILCELDYETSQKIDKNDTKKIIRAIEIIKTTKEKISQQKKEAEFEIEWIGRNFNRDELYIRINDRVDSMMKNGLLDETKYLLKKHGRIDNLLYTIGYQEMLSYIDNKISLEDAIEQLKQNTRRYAKRQLTWFRKNESINWNIYPEVLKK